jgi:hypothetical protein
LPSWVAAYPYSCNNDTAKTANDIRNLILFPDKYLATDPIGAIINPSGYLFTSPECADCTLRGSKTPPAFWK